MSEILCKLENKSCHDTIDYLKMGSVSSFGGDILMRNFLSILFLIITMIFCSISLAYGTEENYLEAEGVIYYEKGMSPNQMRRMAIMDAYRYLAEQTDTLYVSSNSTVKNLRELDEQINAKVEATLRGAKVVSVIRENDGSFHATVRLPLYGSNQSLASATLGQNVVIEDFPKPKFVNITSEIYYTGLIVDCRGLNISQAFAPAIKSVDGVEIYAYKNIGYSTTVSKGMVEYSDTLNAPRAGNSPLIVKAVKISDKCDVVVSTEDSDKILSANQLTNFLKDCAVVFVR